VPAPITRQRTAALAIHAVTASGAVTVLFALQAILDGNIRAALLWLIVAQILDGLDGPIARRIDVVVHAPQVDGHVLDLVVDYVTCVVVPVAIMIAMKMLPAHQEVWIAGLILFSAALWFSRADQETSDHWFNGFPAAWNVVIPTFLILDVSPNTVAAVSVFLSLLQFTTLKMPHIVRVRMFRSVTLPLAFIYFLVLTYLSALWGRPDFAEVRDFGQWILLGFPAYVMGISIYRTWFVEDRISRTPRSGARRRSGIRMRRS
jgi:phosphatidylcholine synthase